MESEVRIPDYMCKYLVLISHGFNFENKSVFEVGGSNISYALVVDMDKLKAKLWLSLDVVTQLGEIIKLNKILNKND